MTSFSANDENTLTVGLTELHGIAREVMANPPDGVRYLRADHTPTFTDRIIKSPAIGVLRRFDGNECDVLEAPLFPILTDAPWVYTPARFSGATSFNLLGAPLPRSWRVAFVKHLFMRDNFVRLIFKSEAGARTLQSYARIRDERLLKKVEVVYPCMREVPESIHIAEPDKIRFMLSGDFFLKGGASVIDAFVQLASERNDVFLRVCSQSNLRIGDKSLQRKYLDILNSHPHIEFGAVDRETMLSEVLPRTDVYVTPTFQEAFGFANLEASAYGIPVISTKHFAIPEVIEHGSTGFLIETDQYDFISKGSVRVLDTIPADFHNYLSGQVYQYMKLLAEDTLLRKTMGAKGRELARERFSFSKRNSTMQVVYEDAKRIAHDRRAIRDKS